MALLDWQQHADRAETLAAVHSSAAEILTYYAKLARILATDPDWQGLLEWAIANSTTELAAIARDASPDGDSLFARAFQMASSDPYQPKVTEPWPRNCPCCGAKPAVAVLRPEADGSRRSLICSRCAYEWRYQRILCPHCQEQDFEKLPVYIAGDFPHLRVECCSTCNHYLISTDLSKDPSAVPLVEDIAALPLHLWAADRGYTKNEPNWFGY